jgi:hypothetical protein
MHGQRARFRERELRSRELHLSSRVGSGHRRAVHHQRVEGVRHESVLSRLPLFRLGRGEKEEGIPLRARKARWTSIAQWSKAGKSSRHHHHSWSFGDDDSRFAEGGYGTLWIRPCSSRQWEWVLIDMKSCQVTNEKSGLLYGSLMNFGVAPLGETKGSNAVSNFAAGVRIATLLSQW